MEVKELRIGNYVSNGNNEILVDCHTIYDNSAICSNLLKPIPLTEEWLLDFGFTGLGCGDYKKGTILLYNEYTDKGVWYVQEDSSLLRIDVIYVHQLQNLHFALTNEDLTNK